MQNYAAITTTVQVSDPESYLPGQAQRSLMYVQMPATKNQFNTLFRKK